ncbi:RIP metalloprotease RseP [Candidatus Peregrinibacteria bacterium]|jgi:regulator of sigma E protease|nr:RIP metalloprotease RseP [Candidatus Peregrinibacteria bacterium]MBT7484236.1 RIP metalloprotease RseP [Candidatus Peregrinibacteria bacterium]MBT7703245.1 RIP metalloprotease RseP [Candidatus Peregrinibacteria bacterium]
MQLLLTILVFILIFSVLILVHEFGHFFVARRNGIKVEEFGFGLPPRLWGKKHGETIYSINWIPFGGFVRMLGEDPRDKKASKSPRSFMRKTKWQRTKVVCAGVLMNFLLAWVLLTVGFIMGMQPLMVNGDDFMGFIRDGRIELTPGLYVDSVEEWSWAENLGFVKGDQIETINGESIRDLAQVYSIIGSDETFTLNGLEFDPNVEGTTVGLSFNVFEMPRVTVGEVETWGVQPGDVILTLNDQQIFYAEELGELLASTSDSEWIFEVFRNGEVKTVTLEMPHSNRAMISQVFFGTPAEEAGLQAGDLIISVNEETVWTPEQAVTVVKESELDTVIYRIRRDSVNIDYEMERGEDGLIGVLLGLYYDSDNEVLSYYDGLLMSSVTEIQDVQYAWHQAPIEAFSEMKRISAYTAVMVGQLFGDIFTTASVPEGVAGPVGIAQMTGLYVQEGFAAIIRFVALLSLSLGVINIFPFPALDGGRMAFIIVEAVRGKPVDAKVEGMIHSLGFLFLIIVIFMVTFQDIARLF